MGEEDMSRLRRDRQAMKWARYSRRNERLARHPGDVRETPAHWRHLGYLLNRKVKATHDEVRYWDGIHKTLIMFHDGR